MKLKIILFVLLMTAICGISAGSVNYTYHPTAVSYLTLNNSYADVYGHTFTGHGDATIDTVNKQFGAGSLSVSGAGYLDTPDSPDWAFKKSFTVGSWFRKAVGSVDQTIIGQSTDTASSYWHLYLHTDNKLNFATVTGNMSLGGSTAISDTNFHYGAVTYNATTDTGYLCLDGHVESTSVHPGLMPDVPDKLAIGRIGNYTGFYFTGNIDDVVIDNGTSYPCEAVPAREYLTNPSSMMTSNVTSGLVHLATRITDITIGNASITTQLSVINNSNSSPEYVISTSSPANVVLGFGNWSLNWTVMNAFGYSSSYGLLNVTDTFPPTPQFTSFNTVGPSPFTSYFYDTSVNFTTWPLTYSWDMGDGNTSTSRDMYYTYNATGNYTVKHSVDDGYTKVWQNVTDYVTVAAFTPVTIAPVASFYGGPQIGVPPLTVFFTDVSKNTPTSWNWSFGDGTFSESQNPSHVYSTSGFFTVNLTATNTAGSNMTSQTNFIMVQ